MRSGLWLAAGLAALSAACSNEVVPTTDAESAKTHALITIEHTSMVGASADARTEAFARFVSLPTFGDDETVLDLAGMSPVLSSFDSCIVPKVDSGVSLATLEPVEFLGVGEITVQTRAAQVHLAPHAFPTVTDVFSGVVYSSRDRSAPLPAATAYSVRATGSAGIRGSSFIAPLEVSASAPSALEGVAVGGVPLESVTEVSASTPMDLTWAVGDPGDSVVVALNTLNGDSLVCAFPDDRGFGSIPDELLVAGEGRLSVHRVRSVDFEAAGIDAGELRFDFEIAAAVDFR